MGFPTCFVAIASHVRDYSHCVFRKKKHSTTEQRSLKTLTSTRSAEIAKRLVAACEFHKAARRQAILTHFLAAAPLLKCSVFWKFIAVHSSGLDPFCSSSVMRQSWSFLRGVYSCTHRGFFKVAFWRGAGGPA